MLLSADYMRTCLKCALTFFLSLSLFCSPSNARVLGTSLSAHIRFPDPPSNTTDATAFENLDYDASPIDLGIPRVQHLWRRAGDHNQPKPASDAELADATSKGCNLMYMMTSSADDALKRMQLNPKLKTLTSSQSKWTNAGDLKTYGWDDKRDINVNWGYAGVSDAMKELNIDINDKSTSNVQLLQNKEFTVSGTKYSKSGGIYNQHMNTAAGLITAYYIYSPAHEGKRNSVPGPYTPLAQYSDVSFLYWSKLCGRTGQSTCGLKNFLFINIENPNTWAIVLKALQNKTGKTSLANWPGTEFSMDTPEGKALLSTQIGTPLAWFLIQHKSQLGASKTVTKARVFLNKSMTNRDTDKPYPSIMFYVDDGPADTHCTAENQCCCPNLK